MDTRPEFTAHNIRLDNGEVTKPDAPATMERDEWFLSARRVLNLVFPTNKERYRIADLGCLEGGYAVEFARMGFNTLGVEIRDLNFRCCEYVKRNVDLPNLEFVQDDVWNIAGYGEFDAVFCCGLLYHLDKPRKFLEQLARQTRRLLILQTHFSTEWMRNPRFHLSQMSANESLKGRWYMEFPEDASPEMRQTRRWASFQNNYSFWVTREGLIGLIYDLGFHTVFEQFDSLAPNITGELEENYWDFMRGTFIGIKDP